MSLAVDAGRLFEAGFMLGVIRATRTMSRPPADLLAYYSEQKRTYHIAAVVEEFAKQGGADKDALRALGRFYLLKGHLAGYHALREYLVALAALNGEQDFRRQATLDQMTLRYWQCTLLGDNRLEPTSPAQEKMQWQQWLDFIKLPLDQVSDQDRQEVGGFLRADLLMWFHDDFGNHDAILVIDASSFGPGRAFVGTDLTLGNGLLDMLHRDVLYMANKGAFSRLALEAHTPFDTLFTDELQDYFTAFVSDDRETTKLIQAASYAYGFTKFARDHQLIGSPDTTIYHIAGYSDRGLNTMTLTGADERILAACRTIYSKGKKKYQYAENPIDAAREKVLQRIQGNLMRLFPGGGAFIMSLPENMANTSHQEVLESSSQQMVTSQTYFGTAAPVDQAVLQRLDLLEASRNEAKPDARWAHKALVKRALHDPDPNRRFVFLTGNPGIGKTTAISEYVKEFCHDEGYLMIYASPRKSVNRDIFEKFKDENQETGFYATTFLGLETNSDIIKEAGGGMAVKYFGDAANLPSPEAMRHVQFLTEEEERALSQHRRRGPMGKRVRQVAANAMADTNAKGARVIDSLGTAIGASLSTIRPNHIVAAVALQSLRRDARGITTLSRLLPLIFAGAQNRENRPPYDRQKMETLAAKTRHLIFMLDEVTGDASGYAFFQGIVKLVQAAKLEEFGFTVKIIVADASLAGVDLVRQHLRLGQTEPDSRKIYVAKVAEEHLHIATDPIASSTFAFASGDPAKEDAWLVNSNTFPASKLHIQYHIHIPTVSMPPELALTRQNKYLSTYMLDQEIDGQIVRDVCDFLMAHPAGQEQAIVYVQNKRRLAHIIDLITSERHKHHLPFVREQEFMEIHADISEHQRALIESENTRNRFSVFFITSSASRGLTFSKARFLFVDVPRFQIETNLMEIVQVIYRGRGGDNDTAEKYLTFYLSDHIVLTDDMTPEEQQWRQREQVLDIMTMLALLKMCILTRITGAATIAKDAYSIVPIGGKSVAGGGRAYHHDLASLHKSLADELRGTHAHDLALTSIYHALSALMDCAEIRLPATVNSYLALYRDLSVARLDEWLTEDGALPPAFTLGSLLIVPTTFTEIQTIHHMRLPEAIALATSPETLAALQQVISHTDQYAAPIHTLIRDFAYLIEELQQVDQSQQLEQEGIGRDNYYVIPLAMFVAKASIAEYCAELDRRNDDITGEALKSSLVQLVRDPFPIDTLLPVGWRYNRFPYLFISSSDLQALRAKSWKQGHILMSPEMNVLTMFLAKEK